MNETNDEKTKQLVRKLLEDDKFLITILELIPNEYGVYAGYDGERITKWDIAYKWLIEQANE